MKKRIFILVLARALILANPSWMKRVVILKLIHARKYFKLCELFLGIKKHRITFIFRYSNFLRLKLFGNKTK